MQQHQDGAATAVLSIGLVGSLLPSMSFPATMPAVVADLGLSASEAGWIGGIYFAGYAGAVPLLATLTDRVGAKSIYLVFSVAGAVAVLRRVRGSGQVQQILHRDRVPGRDGAVDRVLAAGDELFVIVGREEESAMLLVPE